MKDNKLINFECIQFRLNHENYKKLPFWKVLTRRCTNRGLQNFRLTAFASRVFCAAQGFDGIEIDEALLCDSVSWILENQRQDGAFPEVKDIIHKSMMVSYILHVV